MFTAFLGECLWRELSLYILSYDPSSQSTTFSCHIFTSNSVTLVTNNVYVAQSIEYNRTEKLELGGAQALTTSFSLLYA